jgi:hypothetical protein
VGDGVGALEGMVVGAAVGLAVGSEKSRYRLLLVAPLAVLAPTPATPVRTPLVVSIVIE